MLGVSQIKGAWRIHQMIEASKWMTAYPRPLSDADREYFSWFPIRPPSVAAQEAQQPSSEKPDAMDAARYRMLRRGQHWSVINGIGDTLRAEVLDAAIDAAMGTAAPSSEKPALQVGADRFFMDHGMWHDRVTGQHLFTQDQYDAGRRDAVTEHCEREEEQRVLSARRAALSSPASTEGALQGSGHAPATDGGQAK